MASYAWAIRDRIFGLGTDLNPLDWWVGLYSPGDPLTDLASCEIAGTRQGPITLGAWSDYQVYNTGAITFAALSAGWISGWFVTNGGTTTDCSWLGAFASDIWVNDGDMIVLPVGDIQLGVNDSTAIWSAPVIGGGVG